MAAQRVLKMVFDMQGDKKLTLSLADPKNDLTRTQAMTVMNSIVDNSVITYNGFDVVDINTCYVYETEKIELTDS